MNRNQIITLSEKQRQIRSIAKSINKLSKELLSLIYRNTEEARPIFKPAPQINPSFKLERNLVIYSRLLAGESAIKLSKIKGYPSTQAIYGIARTVEKYIKQGLIPPVKPYED